MDTAVIDRVRAARGEEFERLARQAAPEAFAADGPGTRALRNLDLPTEDAVFWLELLGRKAPYSDADLDLLRWRLWETERAVWVAAARARGRFAAQGGRAWDLLREEVQRRTGGRPFTVSGSDDRRLAVAIGQWVALGASASAGPPPPTMQSWSESGVPPIRDAADLGDSDLAALLTAMEPVLAVDRYRPSVERWLAAVGHALPRRFNVYSTRCLVGLLHGAADAGCAPANLSTLLESALGAIAEFRPTEPNLSYRMLRETAATLDEAVAMRRPEPVARALERLPTWDPVLAALFARALARLGGTVAPTVLEDRLDGEAPLRAQARAFLLLDVCGEGRSAGEVRYWALRRFTRMGLTHGEITVELARTLVDLARTPEDWRRLPGRLRGAAVWLAGELGNSLLDFRTVRLEELFGIPATAHETDPRAAFFDRWMARLEAAGSGADELASATKRNFLRFGDLDEALRLLSPAMPLNLEKALAAWFERRLLEAAADDPFVLLYRILTRRPSARFLDRLFADRGRPADRQLRKIVQQAVRLVAPLAADSDANSSTLLGLAETFYAGLHSLSGDDPAREEIDFVGRSRFLPVVRVLLEQLRGLRGASPLDPVWEDRLRRLLAPAEPLEEYARATAAPPDLLGRARDIGVEVWALRARAAAATPNAPLRQRHELEAFGAALESLGEAVAGLLAFPEVAQWRALNIEWRRALEACLDVARLLVDLDSRTDLLAPDGATRALQELHDLPVERLRSGDPDGRRLLGFRRHLLARCLATANPAPHLDALLVSQHPATAAPPAGEAEALRAETLAHRIRRAIADADYAWADGVLAPSLATPAGSPLPAAAALLSHRACREAARELSDWLLDRYDVPTALRVQQWSGTAIAGAARWRWLLHYTPMYVATLAGCIGLLDIGDVWDRLIAVGRSGTAVVLAAGAFAATYAYLLGDARRRSAESGPGSASAFTSPPARRVQRVLAAAYAIAIAINGAVLGSLGESRPIELGDRSIVLSGGDFALQVAGWAALSLFIGVFLTILAQGGSVSRSTD